MGILIPFLFFATLFPQEATCSVENLLKSRSFYSPGDTLSIEDQNMLFPVCNGSDGYATGDTFSFSDLSEKITLISMNATW